MAIQATFNDILKLVALWIALLILPVTETTLLDARTYYGLFIGLGLVFVMYGLTIRSIFALSAAQKAGAILHLDCVPAVVFFYLLHSGCLCYRIRSLAPHVGALSCKEPPSN